MALTHLAHQIVRAHIQSQQGPKRLAVDATCGNGHDTLFLCSLGFQKVIGFDIQIDAIEATRSRLRENGFDNYELMLESHTHIGALNNSEIDCAMFNLGYLPGGDKGITTVAKDSQSAIQQTLNSLNPHGIASVLCYPGHPQGSFEAEVISETLNSISSEFDVDRHHSQYAKASSPILYIVRRV